MLVCHHPAQHALNMDTWTKNTRTLRNICKPQLFPELLGAPVNTNWLCMLPREEKELCKWRRWIWLMPLPSISCSSFSYVSAMSWIDQWRQTSFYPSGLKATGGFWKSLKEDVTGFVLQYAFIQEDWNIRFFFFTLRQESKAHLKWSVRYSKLTQNRN